VKIQMLVLAAGLLFLAGCTTGGVRRGQVVMKTSENTAHVAMGAGEVKVGDHVELYHNQCTGGGSSKTQQAPRECKKIGGGHGEVVEVLSPDYSTVKFPTGTEFTEGDTIEMHVH
jgi:hypothetical protein